MLATRCYVLYYFYRHDLDTRGILFTRNGMEWNLLASITFHKILITIAESIPERKNIRQFCELQFPAISTRPQALLWGTRISILLPEPYLRPCVPLFADTSLTHQINSEEDPCHPSTFSLLHGDSCFFSYHWWGVAVHPPRRSNGSTGSMEIYGALTMPHRLLFWS